MMKKLMNTKIVNKVWALVVLALVISSILVTYSMDILTDMDKYSVTNGSYNKNAQIFIIGVAVLFEVIIFLGGFMLVKAIKTPLKEIIIAIEVVADGGVEIDPKKMHEDEFGTIIDALNTMADNIKKNANVAEIIANDDLSIEVKPKSEIDVLGKSFKKLLDDHNQVLGSIREASSQVSTGSEHVAAASQSIAQGSTEQASALEEISASIEDIAQRTKVNAEEANNANHLVQDAKIGAIKGNEQMKEMMVAMTEINESSESISKIIKVIDDIAFQTNILALNAAVEAARAGAQGKGFAVVAEEVRNLAAKSAQAASETAELIENSISKVAKGSELAEETQKALNEIVDNIDNIVEIISQIAAASNEQATAVAQIDQAIGQVSQVVQSNSATSEECAAASEELSNQAIRLKSLIAKFKLRSI